MNTKAFFRSNYNKKVFQITVSKVNFCFPVQKNTLLKANLCACVCNAKLNGQAIFNVCVYMVILHK